jgi:hypothetical protein
MTKHLSIIHTIFLLIFVSSCNVDAKDVFADQTCLAPCWREIAIGMNIIEGLDKLKNMSDVDPESITSSITNRPYMQTVVNWQFEGTKNYGNLIINENRISGITFSIGDKLSLSTLCNIYGDPDSVIIEKQSLDGTYLNVYMLYTQRGICVEYQPHVWPFYDYSNYKIKPSDQVQYISYVDATFLDWRQNLCNIGFNNEELNLYLQSWDGFQGYPVYNAGEKQ